MKQFDLPKDKGPKTPKKIDALETYNLDPVIAKDLKALPKEQRESLGSKIFNIGFKVEKWKSEWFAKNLNELSKDKDSDGEFLKDKKGIVADFTRALRDSFQKDADMAQKKLLAGNNKLSSLAYLSKNIIRPARLIGDAFRLTSAGGQRWVMATGMLASRLTGAAKEARLSSDKMLEKTQFGSTEEEKAKAEDEAWGIYEKAGGKADSEDNMPTADALKTTYLKEIPKDLQERLREPHTANSFTQKLLRKDMEWAINKLNRKIAGIDNNYKINSTKKKAQKEKLLREWEKRLTDYDRILTKTGTVDEWASLWKSGEFASKTVVRLWTLESLYELWSHIGSAHEIVASHPSTAAPEHQDAVNVDHSATPESTPIATPSPTPVTSPTPETISTPTASVADIKVPTFHDEGITFDHGQGGIKGIWALKKELAEKFQGDFSNAPKGVEEFINEPDVMKQARELGFLNDKGESLKIFKGATLRFDEEVGKVVSNNMGSHEYVPNVPKPEIMETVTVEHPEPILHKVPEEAVGEKIVAPKAPEPEIIPETKTNIPRQTPEQLEVERALGLDKEKIQPAEAFFDTHETPDTVEPLEKRWDEETIRNSLLSKMNDMDHHPAPVGVSDHAHDLTTKIIGNHFNFDQETLGKIDKVYEYFSQYKNGWEGIRSQSANFIMRGNSFKGYDNSPNMSGLLKNLVEVSGKKPHSGWFFGHPETVEHYVARALQQAAKIGKLDQLKLNK